MSTTIRQKYTPATYLLQFFDGNASATGRHFGLSRATISKWTRPKEHQGREGSIPVKHWVTIIDSGYMTLDQLRAKSFEATPPTPRE